MNWAVRVVVLVVCGVVGGWVGYWLGHLFGWSEDAEWPGEIGSGSGAILLAIALSVVCSARRHLAVAAAQVDRLASPRAPFSFPRYAMGYLC